MPLYVLQQSLLSKPLPVNGIDVGDPYGAGSDLTTADGTLYIAAFVAPSNFTMSNIGATNRTSNPAATGGAPILRMGIFTIGGGTGMYPITPVAYTDNLFGTFTGINAWINSPLKYAANLSTLQSTYQFIAGQLYAFGFIFVAAATGSTGVTTPILRMNSLGTGANQFNNTRSPRISMMFSGRTEMPTAALTTGASSPTGIPVAFLN